MMLLRVVRDIRKSKPEPGLVGVNVMLLANFDDVMRKNVRHPPTGMQRLVVAREFSIWLFEKTAAREHNHRSKKEEPWHGPNDA